MNKNNENMKRVDLMMPQIMIDNLDKLVDKIMFETRSNLIRQAVKEYLDKKLILEGIVNE